MRTGDDRYRPTDSRYGIERLPIRRLHRQLHGSGSALCWTNRWCRKYAVLFRWHYRSETDERHDSKRMCILLFRDRMKYKDSYPFQKTRKEWLSLFYVTAAILTFGAAFFCVFIKGRSL